MRNMGYWPILLTMGALVAVALAGCGGGAGPGPPGTGSVQGQIINLDTNEGAPGATVTIANRSTVSSSDGTFRVSGIPAGNDQEVIVTPTRSNVLPTFELVGSALIYCDVTADQTTTLLPIFVLPTGGGPPGPP